MVYSTKYRVFKVEMFCDPMFDLSGFKKRRNIVPSEKRSEVIIKIKGRL